MSAPWLGFLALLSEVERGVRAAFPQPGSRTLFRSKLSGRLVLATFAVVLVAVALPYLPFAGLLGLTPLPLIYYGAMALIVVFYIGCGELAKRLFYRAFDTAPSYGLIERDTS